MTNAAREKPSVPGWVKLMGAIGLALVVVAGGVMALGHNPLQHIGHGMAGMAAG